MKYFRTALGYLLLFVVIFTLASWGLGMALDKADAAPAASTSSAMHVKHYPLHFGPSVQTTVPDKTCNGCDYDHIAALRDLPYGHLAVVFTNGASYDMAPCRYEDGHRCYWNAHAVGNRVGHSSIRLLNRTWWVSN